MSILTWAAELGANAVAPGSGILIRLGRALKPLVPWLLLAAGIAALVLWIDHRGYARGKASQEPVLARALDRMTAAQAALGLASASIQALRGAIDQQNQATLALAQREREAQAATQAALREALARDAGRQATIAKLLAAAGKPMPGAPCDAPAEVKEVWK